MRGVTSKYFINNFEDSDFYSHASCEAWQWQSDIDNNVWISTHTPHARRDQSLTLCIYLPIISTHTPHARRDIKLQNIYQKNMISTHTPHARRDGIYRRHKVYDRISTHTPHARRDVEITVWLHCQLHFYSHASCEAWRGCVKAK